MLDPGEMMNTIQTHANSALGMTLVEYKPVSVLSANGTVMKINKFHP